MYHFIASIASSSELSLVDPATVNKLLHKKEKTPGTIKLKKSIAKNSKPKDGEITGKQRRSPSMTTTTPRILTALQTQKSKE